MEGLCRCKWLAIKANGNWEAVYEWVDSTERDVVLATAVHQFEPLNCIA